MTRLKLSPRTGKAWHVRPLPSGLERLAVPLAPASLVVVVTLIGVAMGGDIVASLTPGLVDVVLVVGVYIFVGNTGTLTFGHMAFMGVGGYVAGILTMPIGLRLVVLPQLPGVLARMQLPDLPATFVAGAVAMVIALIAAAPLMRLTGLAAGMGTFAILQIAEIVGSSSTEVTNGTSSLSPITITTSVWVALVAALLSIGIAFAFQESRVGLRLRAAREDEAAAAAAGVNVYPDRIIAFCLSAGVVAVGGALYAHYFGVFSPSDYYLSTTFLILAMLIVGGQSSLLGAVVGAVVIGTVSGVLVRVEEGTSIPSLTEIVLAVVLLVVLIGRPGGIAGGNEFEWRWFRPAVARLRRRGQV